MASSLQTLWISTARIGRHGLFGFPKTQVVQLTEYTSHLFSQQTKQSMEGSYDRIAPIYDLLDLPFEWLYYRKMRKKWIGTLRGEKVLEVGVGTGKNLEYYHPTNEVVAIDRSRGMLSLAAKRRKQHTKLFFQPEIPWQVPSDFTTVVATFVLCTMKEPQPVLEEIRRHLRLGGKLIIFEFARSRNPLLYKVEKAINPLTRLLFGVDFTRKPTIELLGSEWKLVDVNWAIEDMIYQAMIERKK
ncbi:MAG: methyltransferase domain-containing protein [Methanobacteriota archaeon]|nr:MAG: methyltransferase domain-containing protein [Euryarchaeota archaeon]